MIHFEETELRLGLPGDCNGSDGDLSSKSSVSNGKRGFSEIVDLKLNLSNEESSEDIAEIEKMKDKSAKPPAKAQVVGWPPIRSYRKNVMTFQKNSCDQVEKVAGPATTSSSGGGAYVKVSMDGAPYLRKVDLKLYKSYQEL